VTDGTPDVSGTGLRGALAQLGGSLLALLRTRLELVALEFDEERERTTARLVLSLVAVLFFAFAVFAASALVVVLFWETHRIAALCGITVAYLLVGCAAWWRLRVHQRDDAPPFAATLAELEHDRAWLAGEVGREK
jgi:uncharacterized membrane protein YqjE